MSQSGFSRIPTGILPPSVPTSFVTNSGTAVPALGILNILGSTSAAGSTPFQFTGSGNTVTGIIQRSQAIASTDSTKIGLAAFNSAQFTVDANGFVSTINNGTITSVLTANATPHFALVGTVETVDFGITNLFLGDNGSNITSATFSTAYGQLSGTALTSGVANSFFGYKSGNSITSAGACTAIGFAAQYLGVSGNYNTSVGYESLYAVVSGTNNIAIGYLAGSIYAGASSSNIAIGNNGVNVTESNTIRIGTQGSGAGQQNLCFIAGIVGVTASNPVLTTINSSTGQLGVQALTQYNVVTGGASNAVNLIAPSATSGVPFISQGSSSQPTYGTAVVAGGGTGDTSFTAYSVICGGTTSTGALQNVSGVGSSGQVLTSNGASALPTWQAGGGGFTPVNFAVKLSGNIGGVTGDGTQYLIAYDTVTFDSASGFNTGTHLYTFPTTGIYQLNATFYVYTSSGSSTSTTCLGYFYFNGSTNLRIIDNSPGALGLTVNGEFIAGGTYLYSATAGDTVGMYIQLGGGTKNIGVAGGTESCLFSGFRVA
jgi:hypothetical protein